MRVYIIKIIGSCENCWYKKLVGTEIKLRAIRSTMTVLFSRREVYKILDPRPPLRYVELHHAHILEERNATKPELYGEKTKPKGSDGGSERGKG